MSILVLGSLNKDHVYCVEHMVRPGETLLSRDHKIFWGGKGFNQSVALQKAGATVAFACQIAPSDEAIIRDLLRFYQLDDNLLSTDGTETGHAIIQLDYKGQNSILLYPGANHEIKREWIDRVLGFCGEEDWILLQNEINNLDYIIYKAHERGMKIALNPSPFQDDLLSLPLNLIDMFILNEVECEAFTGKSIQDDMMASMLQKYPEAKIILTLGKDGVVYKDKMCSHTLSAFPVKVVDTTAAGDTFTGYFLAEYIKSGEVKTALNIASKAAALAVTVKGATNSIPDYSQVETLSFEMKTQ